MECKDLQTQGMWSKGLGTPVMSKEEVMAVLRSFGMGKFAGAVMWVLNEVFSMPTQLSINDERLMIYDCLHTESTDETEVSWRSSVLTALIIYPQMLDRCYTDFHLFQICLASEVY